MALSKSELIDAYESWLLQYKWNWFVTLTFRASPSYPQADRLFKQWINEIQRAQGLKDFRWIRVTERGAFGDNLHFHCLVGGLRDATKWDWLFRWEALAGDATILYYGTGGGGLRYMLKSVDPNRDFDFEADFGHYNEVFR